MAPWDLAQFQHMPSVGSVMTPFPHSVDENDPIARVEAIMRDFDLRHVPVLRGHEIVGLISQRDLRHRLNAALPRADLERIRACHLATPNPYAVELHTPLDAVLREMATRKLGSALVLRQQRLAGIVSVTDVCRLLADLLEARFGASTEGGDAA